MSTVVILCMQTLEEPGSDSTKFDQFVPTIVKPITRETYVSDVVVARHSEHFSLVISCSALRSRCY